MSEPTTPTDDSAEDSAPSSINEMTGNLEDILADLNLEPETDAEREAYRATERKPAKVAVKRDNDEDGEKVDAKAETEKKDDAEDPDVAMLKEIRRKSAERKRAAAEANRTGQPRVEAKPEPEPAKAADKAPAAAKPTPAESEVAAAVRDVVASIARLTADEEAAKGGDAGADARSAALKAIEDKIAKIGEAVGDSKALAAKHGDLEAKLQAYTDQRFIEQRIDETLTKIEDRVPLLSSRRNAVALVQAACVAFYQKTGKYPPLEFAASKAEAVLARREKPQGASPEKTGAKAGEKQPPSRKTVSSSLATPPSQRVGPDKRTPKEVESDLFKSLGIDPDE